MKSLQALADPADCMYHWFHRPTLAGTAFLMRIAVVRVEKIFNKSRECAHTTLNWAPGWRRCRLVAATSISTTSGIWYHTKGNVKSQVTAWTCWLVWRETRASKCRVRFLYLFCLIIWIYSISIRACSSVVYSSDSEVVDELDGAKETRTEKQS